MNFDFDYKRAFENWQVRQARARMFTPTRDASEFETLEDIAEYVRDAYAWQNQQPGSARLPLSVAEPDVLLARAIKLAGHEGIRDADLRSALPLAKERVERALARLHAAGTVRRSKELRPDRAGRVREQNVWRLADAKADP